MNYYIEVLKKYAVFTGRARRKEYWMFVLWNIIISLALFLIGLLIIIGATLTKNASLILMSYAVYVLLVGGYSLAIILPSFDVGVRRLHDTNNSGWWMLISLFSGIFYLIMVNVSNVEYKLICSLVCLICTIVMLVFFVKDSQPGDNKYGSNPKGIVSPQVEVKSPTENRII